MYGILPNFPYRNDWQNNQDNASILTQTNIIKHYKIQGEGVENPVPKFQMGLVKTL